MTDMPDACQHQQHNRRAGSYGDTILWAVTYGTPPCGCRGEKIEVNCSACLGVMILSEKLICLLCQGRIDGTTVKYAVRL